MSIPPRQPAAILDAIETYQRRQCLGQLGSIQLCEHAHISWAQIRSHIDTWRQQQCGDGPKDWRSCLNGFNVECHHASHDKRCTDAQRPSWPRATLGISLNSQNVVLILGWAPHCRVDVLDPTADGLIPAPKLRDLFRNLRRIGPVSLLCPGHRYPDALPEMGCLRASIGSPGPCVLYKVIETTHPSRCPGWESPMPGKNICMFYGTGHNGRDVSMKSHRLQQDSPAPGLTASAIDSRCLAIRYYKDILICRIEDMSDQTAKILPTHSCYTPWISAHTPTQCRRRSPDF